MAKILLVKNRFKKEIPAGLIALKSYLDQTYHQSQIYDLAVDGTSWEGLYSQIISFNPEFLGMSTGCLTYQSDLKLIEEAKKRFGSRIIVGGAFASTPGVFEGIADHIVVGRGEEKLLEILDGSDQVVSPRPTHVLNPNAVKFEDYDSPKDTRGNRQFPLYTSLGCKFRCIYCSIPPANERKVWFKDPNEIALEVRRVTETGIHHVRFLDDLFGMHPKTETLLQSLAENGDLRGVSSQIRIDSVRTGLLEKMGAAHFTDLYFGIESYDEKTLRRIGKPYTRRKVREVLGVAKSLGFDVSGAFTIGYPWEGEDDIMDTIHFAEDLNQQFNLRVSVYVVTPFPHTPLSRMVPQERIRLKNYAFWDAKHAVMDTESIRMERIQEIYDSLESK